MRKQTRMHKWSKFVFVHYILLLVCFAGFANETGYREARSLQREGKFDEAVDAYKEYLSKPLESNGQIPAYTDALVQLMNTFQSKGEPETCITALKDVFKSSEILQKQCLRDFYSVMGYALSRTEDMRSAEETMLKALALPLYEATPERYFRDYAYAASVFYSNPDYQQEVVNWCQEALQQAKLCKNSSGRQWVTAMLGSVYKRSGDLNKALVLFQESKDEAKERGDVLGQLNSLSNMTDLFLYWDIPEYANLYASEAIQVEKRIPTKNPMISAQTYINKGRTLHQLGTIDSIPYYVEQARKLCKSLPYNSGMVDVNLLNGIYFTEKGGTSLNVGIGELMSVVKQGTVTTRAKAYHQLAQTYLKHNKHSMAELMLDSLYLLLNQGNTPIIIHIDYKPILKHYINKKDIKNVEKYLELMLHGDIVYQGKQVNLNLIDAIVDLQTGKKTQELKIDQLKQTNHILILLSCIAACIIIILFVGMLFIKQKKQHKLKIRQADEKLAALVQKLNQSNVEKEMIAQEVNDFLKDRENRQELETLTPYILKEDGESKFRQCFELLYPLFLHRLREKVPSVTRREELLSMLIALKQDNRKIAELMAIAPRSVLMLRHRFRQKIGMASEYSLENFIEEIIDTNKGYQG